MTLISSQLKLPDEAPRVGVPVVLSRVTPMYDGNVQVVDSTTLYTDETGSWLEDLVEGAYYQVMYANVVQQFGPIPADDSQVHFIRGILADGILDPYNIVVGVQTIDVDVSTLPAGSQATADMTGEAPSLELDLGIPKGDKGDQGLTGFYQGFETLLDLGNKTGAFNIDLSTGATCFKLTLTGNAVATFTNVPAGSKVISVVLRITQGGAGSFTFDVTGRKASFGANPFANLSTAVGAVDKFGAETWDVGATWDCAPIMQGIA